MATKFHGSLSQDLSIMLYDSDDHNILIQAGVNANIKEFRAHTNILRARSPYFKTALSAKWEAMEFYLKDTLPSMDTLPPRFSKRQIESNIIKPRFACVIANWIDRKDGKAACNKSNLKYKFSLVYCGSRDGINNNSFNNCCPGQAKYLVLVKDQSSKIYGGSYGNYATWRSTTDSFIFSCEENEGRIKNMKISRVTNSSCAIYDCYQNNGFNFGNTFYMSGQNVYLQYQGYYDAEVINSETNINFVPKEIELFNVVPS
ncbi:4585_t:CDS:2 [Funneliformis mosseae]|uniref:4585_t:CDS:1 n=1 Tax=Funneliformis mosseae TaxID=27381 RepID=A0A9N9DVV6_FUNMO|nr:4585_t:CDS:2 [Funneliformis mosseae]